MQTEQKSKVVTGEVRFSFANVFEPKAAPGSTEAKYSVSVLIPKTDKATIAAISAALNHVKAEAATKLGGKLPANFKMPVRDGDKEREGDENYEGHWFINCTSKSKPAVVDKKLQPIGEDDFYSGCYGRVSINFYFFNVNGNKGIAAGLNNIMKTKDGEALAGRSTPQQDFAAFADNDSAASDFSFEANNESPF